MLDKYRRIFLIKYFFAWYFKICCLWTSIPQLTLIERLLLELIIEFWSLATKNATSKTWKLTLITMNPADSTTTLLLSLWLSLLTFPIPMFSLLNGLHKMMQKSQGKQFAMWQVNNHWKCWDYKILFSSQSFNRLGTNKWSWDFIAKFVTMDSNPNSFCWILCQFYFFGLYDWKYGLCRRARSCDLQRK